MKKASGRMILILALSLTLSACQSRTPEDSRAAGARLPEADAVLTGKIVQLNDNSCLIAGSGSSDLYTVSSKLAVYDGNNRASDVSALTEGQNVEVGYSGEVLTIYPAQPDKPAYIKITGQGDDLVGFYQGVLEKLWNTDKGLNPASGVLAFDLSKASNLTDAEKSALIYIVSSSHGLQGVSGTYDELSRQGYIDRERLYFKDGMLFKLILTDAAETGFTFEASKWRSGDGAFFFNGCKAVKDETGWSYTVGSEAIS